MSLGPAARLVGVDPDTLRRWADAGQVDVFTTPGGHRRFERRALERLRDARRPHLRPLSSLGATPDRLSRAYRRRYESTGARPSASAMDPSMTARRTARTAAASSTRCSRTSTPIRPMRGAGKQRGSRGPARRRPRRRLAASGVGLADAVGDVRRRAPAVPDGARRDRPPAHVDPAHLAALYEDASAVLDRLLLRFVAAHEAGGRMSADEVLTSATALLALVFALALFDQWRERRGALPARLGARHALLRDRGPAPRRWPPSAAGTRLLYRDVVPDGRRVDGRLARPRARRSCSGGPGSATRSRLCLFLAGLFTFLMRNRPEYAGAGSLPLLYFIAAVILALAVGVETYFQNERWPVSRPAPWSARRSCRSC